MTVDNGFMIKKLQGLEVFYAIFAQSTRMPYVECDQETFDDQIYLFSQEEDAKNFVKEHTDRQIPVTAVKVDKPQMLMFYTSLYLIGVNRLVFHNGAGESYLPIESVVTMKSVENDDKNPPKMNSTLQLTAIYFLQELRRPNQPQDDLERRKRLQDMEQEMLVNLMRSRFIMPVDISKVEGEFDPKKPNQNLQIPYLKTQNGDILQPIFSDMWEFQKFAQKNVAKLRVATVPFKGLPGSLIKNAKGYVLNPAGVNLVVLREKLELLVSQLES